MSRTNERDAVFEDHFGSRREWSPEASSAWEVYYKEQADRMAQQEGRATPAASVASTSRNGAEREAYYREQARRFGQQSQRDRGMGPSARASGSRDISRPASTVEPGEVVRRPVPTPVPLFSSYYANKPAPIFRGLRYHIHKTTPSHIFGWLRSLLIWNGASLGCFRPDIADVVILYSAKPELNKVVDGIDTGRTTTECRAGNVWETADLYAHLARRADVKRDREARSRTCVVQAEWVEQCVKTGRRIEGGDKGGYEIKVDNGRVAAGSGFVEMPSSIAIAPMGTGFMPSFDFDAGTIPGGPVDEAEPWVCQAPPPQPAMSFGRNDMYALPSAPAMDAPPIASSSNTSGVFNKDQILPLTFHVLNAQEHRSTVQSITRLGGGVMTPVEQATFIIMPIRGTRTIEDPDMQDLVKNIDIGRAVLSVEWVEQCIDEDNLVGIDPYRVVLPDDMLVIEDELHEESSPPRHLDDMPELLPPSPSPPPVKPDISSYFTPAPEPTVMGARPRKRPRPSVPTASTSRSGTGPPRRASPDIEVMPNPLSRRSVVPPPRRRIPQVIDLTISDSDDDDEVEGVEQILPEQTPLPASPPSTQPAPTTTFPRWATADDGSGSRASTPAQTRVAEARTSRGPTPTVFQLTPSARRRRDESTAL